MDVDVSLTDISISLSFCLPLSLKSMKKKHTHIKNVWNNLCARSWDAKVTPLTGFTNRQVTGQLKYTPSVE